MTRFTPIALFALTLAAIAPVATAHARTGDEVDVFVEVQEDKNGQLVLSESGGDDITVEAVDDGVLLSRDGDDPVDVFLETVEDDDGQLVLSWDARDQDVVDTFAEALSDVGAVTLSADGPGDEVDVFVEVQEDKNGQLVISHR